MKKLITSFALLLPAMAAFAVVPQEQQTGRDLNPEFTNRLMTAVSRAAESSENKNSFFEGFEGRDPELAGFSASAWLPSQWTQFSREGNKHVKQGEGYWDLTWLTLSNESNYYLPSGNQTTAFEGESYAYIMADVMWGEKLPYPDLGLDYATNHPQDEWLVTPAFTPAEEEWFYFKLQFRPGWCLYNRDAKDFTGENNLLEVYVTEGDGTADDEGWTKVWSLKDYIAANYTEAELRADLTNVDYIPYDAIFVNVKDFVGKKVKAAFRYYGSNGQGMAIDNVSLGIPMPKPSYTIPSGFFKQQTIDPNMDVVTGDLKLLIPFGAEATWTNTSTDILTNEWAYNAADGSKLTSTDKHLKTPAYEVGKTYATPELTGIFESRSAVYTSQFPYMQAGGRLEGTGNGGYKGQLGIAHYNYLDPKGSFKQNSSTIGFHKDLDDQWVLLTGREPGTLDILGIGCTYTATPTEYGFDYVDVLADVKGASGSTLNSETTFILTVFLLPEDEYDESAGVIGQAVLTGDQINEFPALSKGTIGSYKNLRFNLEVPVVANGNILVLISPYNLDANDAVAFPFMASTDENVWGNSVVYMYVYNSEEAGGTYDTFYNLNAFPIREGGHFAGLIMNLGAAYSYMEAPAYNGSTIELPYTGGEYKLDIRSMFGPENWAVTDNYVTKASWVSLAAEKDANESDLYHTTLTFAENAGDERESEVFITQAGSRVALNVVQAANPTASVSDIAVDNAMTVGINGSTIIVNGVSGEVCIYSTTGLKVASAVAEGSVSFDASSLAHGVYVVRNGDSVVKVIL